MGVSRLGVTAAVAAMLGGVAPAVANDDIPVPVPGPTSPLPGPTLSAAPKVAPSPSCTIEGDGGADRLTGTPGPDVICGHGGNDVLEGLEGDDVLDGGAGVDVATWESSACCVNADLGSGSAAGALGSDQLIGIENLAGSQGTDVLRGSAAANTIAGNGATDLLYGGDGDDWLVGGDGDDWLAGEGGTNILDGGFGSNVCADGGGTFCESPDPGDPADTRGILDVVLVDGSLGEEPVSWRLSIRGRLKASRLWDEGYAVISLDTRGGEELDLHALIGWNKRRPFGLLIGEGRRGTSGKLRARRAGARGVIVEVPAGRLGLDPLRLYYRWAARTIYTGRGCKPCFDGVPDVRAYPQPLLTA